jgi:glucose-1-phosphate adenylyltransferase
MLKNYLGVINLDENEDRIKELTRHRPLASVPIAGRYRIIDFILSNMTNAGIENIGIFTKINSRSLMDHVSSGRPWDLNRKIEGLRIFNFSENNPVYDDIHNFAENMEYFTLSKQEYVIMSPSYNICNIDFVKLAKYHEESKNDITIVYKKVDDAAKHFYKCDVLNFDDQGRVLSVGENIGTFKEANICMEIYVMKKTLFTEIVYDCVRSGRFKKLKKAIYSSFDKYAIGAYEFTGYLQCINSLYSYYKANMEFLSPKVNKEIFYDQSPIYTKSKDESPTKYTKDSSVKNSIIASGCLIEGTVENCIISRKVHVKKGAVLKNCVLLQNCEIGENAKLTHVITDKHVKIEMGEELKGDKDIPLVVERQVYPLILGN